VTSWAMCTPCEGAGQLDDGRPSPACGGSGFDPAGPASDIDLPGMGSPGGSPKGSHDRGRRGSTGLWRVRPETACRCGF
jgi:hypothetical protein